MSEVTPQTPKDDLPAYMTTNDICAWMGVARITVYKWKQRGVLVPYTPKGSLNRYNREDVIEFVESHHR